GLVGAASCSEESTRRTSGRTTRNRTIKPSRNMIPSSIPRRRSSLVNWNIDIQRVGEAQVDHFHLVATFLVEADSGAHQGGNAIDLFLVARLIADLALVVLAVNTVHQHGDRDAIDPAGFDHLGLGDARYLVIDELLRLAVLVAR